MRFYALTASIFSLLSELAYEQLKEVYEIAIMCILTTQFWRMREVPKSVKNRKCLKDAQCGQSCEYCTFPSRQFRHL